VRGLGRVDRTRRGVRLAGHRRHTGHQLLPYTAQPTAHGGHQWLGRYGKTGNGVVTVTTVCADERLYYPVHAVPYTSARHLFHWRLTEVERGSAWAPTDIIGLQSASSLA
jgi:hypothetical protein